MHRKDRQAENLSFKAFLKFFFKVDCTSKERETFSSAGALLVIASLVFIYIFDSLNISTLSALILSISAIFLYSSGIILFIIVYTSISHKQFIHNRALYILLLLFLILAIPYVPTAFGYETTGIGDFYEANMHTEKYYVIISRDSEDIENRKEYALPAEIERRYNVYNESCYYINRLYFPNGGYLVFDYDEAYEDTERTDIALNKETEVIDYHGDYYYMTLTDKKVAE